MSTSPRIVVSTIAGTFVLPVYASDGAFVAAKGSSAAEGDIYFNSADHFVHYYADAAWRSLTDGDSTQTLTGKTLTASANTISHLDSSYQLANLTLTASVAASALTIAVKTKAGTDPSSTDKVFVGFRNATTATGTYSQRTITGALSVVVSSGSTLGHLSGAAHYAYIYLIDNAGTVELAISSTLYDEGSVVTTTAEGGAGGADSASAIYSTTMRSNVPVRLVGRILSTQATAGTWASAITEISLPPFLPVKPFVSYKNTAGTAIAAAGTTVPWATKISDTHNLMNTSTGAVTVNRSGPWSISCGLHLSAAAKSLYAEVQVAGSTVFRLFQNGTSNTDGNGLGSGSRTFHFTAGDVVTVKAYANSADDTLSTDANLNWISMAYVGG